MEKLYEEYGKLMVQQELLNNQIREIKIKISADINKSKKEEESKEE